MFAALLLVTFVTSLAVCLLVIAFFSKPCGLILQRIMADEISKAWLQYLKFAIVVVGVSSGVRVWELEKYITPPPTQLTTDRWVLEVYRTILEALQGISWLLFVFFTVTLLAFVTIRVFEFRRAKTDNQA